MRDAGGRTITEHALTDDSVTGQPRTVSTISDSGLKQHDREAARASLLLSASAHELLLKFPLLLLLLLLLELHLLGEAPALVGVHTLRLLQRLLRHHQQFGKPHRTAMREHPAVHL
jgi:hypothetical protein